MAFIPAYLDMPALKATAFNIIQGIGLHNHGDTPFICNQWRRSSMQNDCQRSLHDNVDKGVDGASKICVATWRNPHCDPPAAFHISRASLKGIQVEPAK